MWRTFIQTSALWLTLEASFFLLKSNLGLGAENIVRLASPGSGYTPVVAEVLARQSIDTTVGLELLLFGFVLQMANSLWEMRWKDFHVHWKGVIYATVFSIAVLVISFYVAHILAGSKIAEINTLAGKLLQGGSLTSTPRKTIMDPSQLKWGYEMLASNWISALALLVSALSALYARYSVQEARRTNEITIHNERLKIFKVILELRGLLTRHGVNIKENDLFSFYEFVQLSEFYYDKSIHEDIKAYFDTAWEIVKQRDLWETAESQEAKKELVAKTHSLLTASREKIKLLEDKMKGHLRLTRS
jgi:hypothetical protein